MVLRIPPEGWEVPPDSFFQNNFFLLPGLVQVVRDRLQAGGARHLLDVYCGVGFFSVELGDLVESFVGVELDRLAIQAAYAASPSASAVKTAKMTDADCVSAKPIAAPISGAVHGVATTVANTPVKKLPE